MTLIEKQDMRIVRFSSAQDSARHDGPVLMIEACDAAMRLFPTLARSRFLEIKAAHLTPELLQKLQPACIVAPLMGSDFDVLDIAALLARAGYCGTLYTVTPALPRPRLVAAEVHAVAPLIDFAMIAAAA